MAKKQTVDKRLQVLLKEVLRNTPDNQAFQLVEAYRAGEAITLSIASSMFGDPDIMQCDFQWSISQDERLKSAKGNA